VLRDKWQCDYFTGVFVMINKILEVVISCFCTVAVFIAIVPLHIIFAPLARSNQPCIKDDDR
jgi:hypothetical protein